MITDVDLNGKTVQEVADAWIAANEARWSDLDPVADPGRSADARPPTCSAARPDVRVAAT